MSHLRIIILLPLILLLHSCGTVKDGFSNQKKNSNDEFLVEKKSPLVMPPDYDQLPVPNADVKNSQNDQNGVKNLIINNGDDKSNSSNSNNSNKNFEESLLEKIKRN